MLDRIPELRVLASHPSIGRALRSGNPHKVYRALWWGQLLGRFKEHKELVKSLLANRRMFLSPIDNAPGMYTLNGIGTRIYGESEPDSQDGSYIGTYFFTMIFVPLFPIRQYLCTSDGSQYQFFGRVPFGTPTYLWRQLVVILGTLGILAAGFTAWNRVSNNDLTIANGLDVPVRVRVGDEGLEIPPNGIVTESFGVGDYHLVTTDPKGTILEEESLSIPNRAESDVVAWNVLGAAFLYENEVPYSKQGDMAVRDPKIFCGEQLIIRNDVDYSFEELPDEISLPEHTSFVYRTLFNIIPGGWRLCAHHLAGSGRPDEGIALSSRFADLNDQYDLRSLHSMIVAARGASAGEAWIAETLATHDGVELHRLRQDAANVDGRYDEMRTIYREYQQAHPDSPEAVYLRARCETTIKAVPLVEEARKQWPENRYLLRSHAWNLHHSRQFAEALPLWQELNSGPDAVWFDYQVEALIALGRTTEAHGVFPATPPASFDQAAFRHKVALAAGEQPAPFNTLDLGYDPDFTAAFIGAQTNTPVPESTLNSIEEPATRATVEVIIAMHSDGPSALQHYAQAPVEIDQWLDTGTHILLLGEAYHADDEVLAARVREVLNANSSGATAARIVGLTATQDDFERLPFGLLACSELAASRNPAASPNEIARLRAAARRDEILESVVTSALDSWAN